MSRRKKNNKQNFNKAQSISQVPTQDLEKAYLKDPNLPDAWNGPFGPGKPLINSFLDLKPRNFNYMQSMNRSTLPRLEDGAYGGVSFSDLRNLSRANALIRGAIEWRKQQLQRLTFSFKPKDQNKNGDRHVNTKIVRDIFKKPDGVMNFQSWLNMLSENILTLDNVYIYPDDLKDKMRFRQIDPATIKRYINEEGETPTDPNVPAYCQIFQSRPSVDWAFDQLYAAQRNPSTDRLYGYSPVEQVMDFATLAIRRMNYQESYYTEGNIPETMVALPEKYSSDQIAEFQELFDNLDALEIKRRIRMMPGGTTVLTTKDQISKDSIDEWLARVICWIFQVPASALITENNRATAETSRKANIEDGLVPFMNFIKTLIDDLITDFLDIHDVEFSWEQEETLDAIAQSQVDSVYLDRGVLDINEVRARLGYAPKESSSTSSFEDGDDEEDASLVREQMGKTNVESQENMKTCGHDDAKPVNIDEILNVFSKIKEGLISVDSAKVLVKLSQNLEDSVIEELFKTLVSMDDQVEVKE